MDNEREHSISHEVLARFAAGEATSEERRLVGSHLLGGCLVCRSQLASYFRAAAPPAGAYDAVFAAAQQEASRELARRHLPAQKLLSELDRLPAERQELKVRNATRYASLELSAAYVERSHEVRYRDTDEMLRYALLALAAAEAAAGVRAGPPTLLHDALARAWGQAGNAHRVRSEVAQAAAAFAKADAFRRIGSGDLTLAAELAGKTASFRTFQRDFAPAIKLYEQEADLYRRSRDRRGEARALIGSAVARILSGEPDKAIAPLQRCIPMLSGRPNDLDLLWAATQNLVYCFVELQEPAHAYDLLALSEPQFAECTDELVHLRVVGSRERSNGSSSSMARRSSGSSRCATPICGRT